MYLTYSGLERIATIPFDGQGRDKGHGRADVYFDDKLQFFAPAGMLVCWNYLQGSVGSE